MKCKDLCSKTQTVTSDLRRHSLLHFSPQEEKKPQKFLNKMCSEFYQLGGDDILPLLNSDKTRSALFWKKYGG